MRNVDAYTYVEILLRCRDVETVEGRCRKGCGGKAAGC